MPYQYTTDLVNDALRRASEPIDGSSEFQAEALDYLNKGLLRPRNWHPRTV